MSLFPLYLYLSFMSLDPLSCDQSQHLPISSLPHILPLIPYSRVSLLSTLTLCWRDANFQRIFNTITQSEKCDPNGDYIRYWVPELKNLKGKAIHDPYHNMPKSEFKKLGYPEPIVDHKTARLRALFRYKNVGEKEEGA